MTRFDNVAHHIVVAVLIGGILFAWFWPLWL